MTTQEIKTALTEYATEDTQIAIESGSMAICDTKKGVITLNHENGIFQSYNQMGEKLTGKMQRKQMIVWLVNNYRVEA